MIVTLGSLCRGALLLAGAVATSAGVFHLTAQLRHPAAPGYDALLVAGAAWGLVLGAAWATLVCAAAVLEVASSGRLSFTHRLGCPAPARRTLLAGLSVVLAGGATIVAGPVSAAPAPLHPTGHADTSRARSGLPVPVRPTGAAPAAVPRQRVEVRSGDSLWRLAQARRPSAPAAEVARLVARTYRTNRRVIGADPDLIRPGQRLVVPGQRRDTPPPPPPRSETP
jgi:LysM repeat protein